MEGRKKGSEGGRNKKRKKEVDKGNMRRKALKKMCKRNI